MRKLLALWIRCLALLFTLGLTLGLAPTARAASPADILWVVDTSGSMGNDIAEVKARIQDFHNAMTSTGIDANYGLVRFGGGNTLIQNITTFADFNRVGGPFRSLTANGGGIEQGSSATLVGLRQATFRPGAVINVIVVTDEDDDSSAADFAALAVELRNRGALFNFIGVPGEGNTDARYVLLASSFGGRAFRINDFRTNPQPFFANFIDSKVREIVNALQCDVDRDNDIDRDDIALINLARNKPAESLSDPRDADRNGFINVLDARQCTVRCTRATCERGVPNTAPVAHAGADLTSELGLTVALDGRASSDANGDPLGHAWTLVSAPVGSNVQLASANTARPTFVPDLVGVYNFNLVVTDGRANSPPDAVAVQVTPRLVTAPAVVGRTRSDAEALLRQAALGLGGITSITSTSVAAGTVMSQSPSAGTRIPAGTLVSLGVSIGNQVVVPSVANLTVAEATAVLTQAGFVVGPQRSTQSAGVPVGRVVGTTPPVGGGAARGSTIELLVSIGPDTVTPVAEISSPSPGSAVQGRVNVIGSATDANLKGWTLDVAPVGDTNWQRLGSGSTPVVGGTLGVFDTSTLSSDFYRLRLTVDDGTFSRSVTADVRVDSDLQIGRFELVYTDLRIPNPGVPLNLIRSYDSSNANQGAFGRSWRLSITDANIREDAQKNVFITLPNGRRSAFAFTPTRLSPFFPGSAPAYTAAAGVYDKLEATACGLVVQSGGRWFCFPGAEYDPDVYLLTTREGIKYTISQSQGIQRVEDAAGNVVSITPGGIRSSAGRSIEFQRDAAGRIISIVDPKGALLAYTYDALGRLSSARDALGQVTSYQYSGNSALITAVIAPGGCQPLRNSYGADGRLASSLDANSQRTTFQYGADGRSKRITNALGQSTLYDYDARGNVVAETDPDGRVLRRSFDGNNNLVSLTLPSGLRTDFTHDAKGNWILARQLRSDGTVLDYRREFNAAGRITRYTTPVGSGLDFLYDSRLNPRQIDVRGDGGGVLNSLLLSYDAQGNLLSSTVGAGTWNFSYDSRGNLLSKVEPNGARTSYAHDANGNTTATTAPDGTTHSFVFDGMDRIVEQARNGSWLQRVSYDAENRPLSVTEAEGGTTRFGYSCSGQLTSVTDAAGAITQYRYDAADRLAEVALPNGQSRAFAYNARSLLSARRDSDGGLYGLAHDADGLLTSLSTPNHPAGQVALRYDNLHQLIGLTRPDFSINSSLDALGRLTGSTEGAAGATRSLVIAYGSQGLPVTVNENGREIRSLYDSLGARTQLTSPDGRVTRMAYDNMRRITSVSTDGTGSVSFVYDADGRRVRSNYSNGAFTTYAYEAGQLRSATLFDGRGAVIQHYAYDITANGYRRAVVNADGRTDFSYDALWRLTGEVRQSASAGNGSSAFSYDAVGNRLQNGLFVSGQRVVQSGTDLYAYDANGNLLSRGAELFRYDSANHLTSYVRGNVSASYTYDGRGRRVRKVLGSQVVDYLYDGQQILAEYNASGALTARYTYGLGADEVLMVQRGANAFFYHADPQGNVVAITNAAGLVVQRYDYDAWGNILRAAGSFAFSGTGLVNTRTFIGREYDSESGLFHLRARAYDPRLGRFLQKDPQQGELSNPQSLHAYAYALNSPTHFADPTGEVAAVQYAFLLKPGKWNSAGALIGFMHGFITPTFSFLGQFFGELNRAGPDADIQSVIGAAFVGAEAQVKLIEQQIGRMGAVGDPYTFAGSYATGLNWDVGFRLKFTPSQLGQVAKEAGIPTKCAVTLIPAQGGFMSGTKQGFDYLRQVLHVPSPGATSASAFRCS